MADWNSELYLKFKRERTQPSIDLANSVRMYAPARICDIGCGPGNSTAVLRSVFPTADIVGIDSSPNMIERAKSEHPELEFMQCDVHDVADGWDMLFSNACLQWVGEHDKLMPELINKLNPGGVLAVQMPRNAEEPFFRIIDEAAHEDRWGFDKSVFEVNRVLRPSEYYDILAACAADFRIWETVYVHALDSHEAMLDWVRGTRLRPFLAALSDAAAREFEAEILARARECYPRQADGRILLRFRRLFFTAVRA